MLDVNVKNKARRSMNATSYHLQQKKHKTRTTNISKKKHLKKGL